MPVTTGSIITAGFYNSLQTTVAGILGTPSAGTGYGQTVASTQSIAGEQIFAQKWQQLQTDINKCQLIQTNAIFSTAQLPNIVSGKVITAQDINLYETQTNLILANKAVVSAANLALTANALTVTRATTWGSATTAITAEVSVSWATVDAKNKFFNTGGVVQWKGAHPSTATLQDTNWNTLLNVVTLSNIHGGTVNSGTNYTQVGVGNLTTAYQTFLTLTGTSSYTANTCVIQMKALASGLGYQIKFVLTDSHTNTFSDIVAAGTNVVFSHLLATANITGVVAPTYAIVTNF